MVIDSADGRFVERKLEVKLLRVEEESTGVCGLASDRGIKEREEEKKGNSKKKKCRIV